MINDTGVMREATPRSANLCEAPEENAVAVLPKLTALPPGAVKPTGWLRDWARSQAKNFTTQLPQREQIFAKGWNGEDLFSDDVKKNGEPKFVLGGTDNGEGWPLEQAGYHLDGQLRLGYILHDPAIIAPVEARLQQIISGLASNGSLFWWNEERSWHNAAYFGLWGASVVARALIAYAQYEDDFSFVEQFAQSLLAYPTRPEGSQSLHRKSVMLEIMVELVLIMQENPDEFPAELPHQLADVVRKSMRKVKKKDVLSLWNNPEKLAEVFAADQHNSEHGVTFNERSKLPAAAYLITGDPEHLQLARNRYAMLRDIHLLPNGGHSAAEHLGGRGAFRSTETCTIADFGWSQTWLYRVDGHRDYGDTIERLLFNAGAAAWSRDCRQHVYFQAPNRMNPDLQGATFAGGDSHYAPLHSPICCSGNITRVLPNYVMSMWMKTADNDLAATLYGPCSVTTSVAKGSPVTIHTTTDYPFNDTITMRVLPEEITTWAILLRIPAWCTDPRIELNGEPIEIELNEQGFVRIHRYWNPNDEIVLQLPMSPRLELGTESEGAPYATISAGPLLFALPIDERDENTPATDDWRYALDLTEDDLPTDLTFAEMPEHWDWPAEAPVSLQVPSQAIDWQPQNTHEDALPDAPVSGKNCKNATTLRLIPYGNAKFRVSMFPVTDKTWGGK